MRKPGYLFSRDMCHKPEMVSAIDDSVMEGLDPSDYHQAQITRLRTDTIDGGAEPYRNAASLHLLLSDALIRLAYHYCQIPPAKPEA